MDNHPGSKNAVSKGGGVFILLVITAMIIPPVGLVAALVLMTAYDGRSAASHPVRRGKILAGISLAAFVIQIILGVVYILPLAVNQMDEVFKPFLSESPYSGHKGPPGRELTQPGKVGELLAVLEHVPNEDAIRGRYEKARKAIKDDSKDPFDRYIVAAVLMGTELGEEFIRDDDARRDEVKRLILDGLALDGKNSQEGKYLDAIMLTPLLQAQLDAGEYQDADATYNRILGIDWGQDFGDLRITIERWAYNSLFEYWQVRKPDRAFSIASATMRQMAWTGKRLQLEYFDYPFYGGLDCVFELSRRYGKEEQFFKLLEYLIKVTEDENAVPQDVAEAHETFGYYLGKAGRWDEALVQFRRATELDPGMPAYRFTEVIAEFNSGRRASAAESAFQATLDLKNMVSMDNMRFLYRDYPSEGAEFLTAKLGEYPDRADIAGNIAILAFRAGEAKLARTALRIMEALQSGEAFADISKAAAEALAAGNADKAWTILDARKGSETTPESAYVRAMLASSSKPTKDIAQIIETAIRFGPYEREPDFPLFETYFSAMKEVGLADDAFSFLREIVKDNPNDAYPLYFLALKLREVGRLDESKAELETLMSRVAPMMGSWMQFQGITVEGSAGWWFQRLNWVDANDINRELAQVAKELGDTKAVDHYLFWAESSHPEDFQTNILLAEREMQKGDLEEAGQILDDISLSVDPNDKNSEPFKQLMAAYAELKSAGWVRERNFTPFPGIPNI